MRASLSKSFRHTTLRRMAVCPRGPRNGLPPLRCMARPFGPADRLVEPDHVIPARSPPVADARGPCLHLAGQRGQGRQGRDRSAQVIPPVGPEAEGDGARPTLRARASSPSSECVWGAGCPLTVAAVGVAVSTLDERSSGICPQQPGRPVRSPAQSARPASRCRGWEGSGG